MAHSYVLMVQQAFDRGPKHKRNVILTLHARRVKIIFLYCSHLRILAMHEAKSLTTQPIKNLRRTFFNNGP